MRIAIVEPYMGGSHATWATGYQSSSAHEVVLICHTDRFWKWRMHGAHVTLASEFAAEVEANGAFDVVVGSSMLNSAGFLGLARRSLCGARFAVYMHENQLGYPLSPRDRIDLSYPMINWTSMVAADLVVFNSEFHRDEWFDAIPRFLRQFPDYQQHESVAAVEERSAVLPVGIDLRRLDGLPRRPAEATPRILWNQRWEYDKDPDALAAAITDLNELGVDFELALAGEQFPTDPDAFVALKDRLGLNMVHYGWAESGEYERLLASSDVVVSTAHHEYFGIAVTEAIYAGAFPVLPNRLVYPERIPKQFHEECLYREDLVERLVWAINHPAEIADIAAAMRPAMAANDWSAVAPRYDNAMETLAATARTR